MNSRKKPDVDTAYALKTPEDNEQLYREWASTYDADFVDRFGYTQHRHVAEQLARRADRIDGAVLDVGCGTGVVGACLRELGIEPVDGIDISREMLDVAATKQTPGGDPVYRNLVRADLTMRIDIGDNEYAGLTSAGTFTHGHLGPESLDELWRVMAPGAQCAFTVRSSHYETAGFRDKLAVDVAQGTIDGLELLEINIYESGSRDEGHAGDTAFIVICQVL